LLEARQAGIICLASSCKIQLWILNLFGLVIIRKKRDERLGKGIFYFGGLLGWVLEVMGRIWRGKWRIFEGLFDYKYSRFNLISNDQEQIV
jgi:hypothetical protein